MATLRERLELEIRKSVRLVEVIFCQSKVIEELEGEVEALQARIASLLTRAKKAEEHIHNEFETSRHAED